MKVFCRICLGKANMIDYEWYGLPGGMCMRCRSAIYDNIPEARDSLRWTSTMIREELVGMDEYLKRQKALVKYCEKSNSLILL